MFCSFICDQMICFEVTQSLVGNLQVKPRVTHLWLEWSGGLWGKGEAPHSEAWGWGVGQRSRPWRAGIQCGIGALLTQKRPACLSLECLPLQVASSTVEDELQRAGGGLQPRPLAALPVLLKAARFERCFDNSWVFLWKAVLTVKTLSFLLISVLLSQKAECLLLSHLFQIGKV